MEKTDTKKEEKSLYEEVLEKSKDELYYQIVDLEYQLSFEKSMVGFLRNILSHCTITITK